MVGVAPSQKRSCEKPLPTAINIDQNDALFVLRRMEWVTWMHKRAFKAKSLYLLFLFALYVAAYYAIHAIPTRLFDKYNPNATFVPVIGPFGYYSSPAAYIHGTCEVVNFTTSEYTRLDVNETTCGAPVYIRAGIRYIYGNRSIPPCSDLVRHDNLTSVQWTFGSLCVNDGSYYNVKLRQEAINLINITLRFTDDRGLVRNETNFYPLLTVPYHISALPRRMSCDYLVEQGEDGSTNIPANEIFFNKSDVMDVQHFISIKAACTWFIVSVIVICIWYQYKLHGAYIWGVAAALQQ